MTPLESVMYQGLIFQNLMAPPPPPGVAPSEESGGSAPGAGSGRTRILIVDDEREIVEEMIELLEDEGYIGIAAFNADQALEIIRQDQEIGIVISDIRMPGLDGLGMARMMQHDLAAGRTISLILVTGHAGVNEAIEALRLGAQDFLLKPINPDHLLHAVHRGQRLLEAAGMEDALAESEARYRTMIQHAPEAIVVIDVETGCFIDANRKARVLFGEERLGDGQKGLLSVGPARQLDGQTSEAAMRGHVSRALSGDVPVFEWTCWNGAREPFPCEIRLVTLPDSRRTLLRASITNITARKQMEAALKTAREDLERRIEEATSELRASESRMRAISDIVPVALLATSETDDRIVFANSGARPILGMEGNQILEAAAEAFFAEAEDHTEIMAEFARAGIVRGREIQIRRGSGEQFWALVSVARAPLADETLRLIAIVDIQALKSTQEELLRAKQEADAASRAKSDFVSNMSHELRTPLNAILGFAQLLRSDPNVELTTDHQRYIAQIESAGSLLLELINDVLDLSHIDSGRVSLAIEDIPLHRLIEECIALVRGHQLVESQDITLPHDGDKSLVARADHGRLRQVIINLLSNALKYNRDKGRVDVGAEIARDGIVRISITDTGIGIPADKQADLFAPFKRLGFETSKVEGSGIGLHLSQRLLEMMNGRIGFESVEGLGSTFWIEIAAGGPDSDPT